MMKIVCISDTHNKLNRIKLPEGDLLIHAGDFSMMGTLKEVEKFNDDLGAIKHKYKYGIVVIAGNHDWMAQEDPGLFASLITNATYLEDSFVTIDGLKIYGAPWQPTFYDWAFNLDRGDPIKEKWDLIPNDIDVLITHGPAYGILDVVQNKFSNFVPKSVGCEELRIKVDSLKNLKLHVFGHLHLSYGTQKVKDTMFINAASLNDHYEVAHQPIIYNV